MASNLADFYTGTMAPPLRLPDGSYIPAPASQAPMSVQDLYRGIYPGSSSGLTARPVNTVSINPTTGMPYSPTVSGSVYGGPGIGSARSGAVSYTAPVRAAPNQPSGSTTTKTQLARLPGDASPSSTLTAYGYDAQPSALKAIEAVAPAARSKYAFTGSDPFSAYSGDYVAKPRMASRSGARGDNTITLVSEPMSEVSGQNLANSFGKPVKGPSGKVYTPSNVPMSGVRPPYDPKTASNATTRQRSAPGTSLLGSLFGGLFGGMQPRAPGLGSVGGSPVLSNGVANPDYRNYGSSTSDGGGLMPANAFGGNGGGGFTDSLGGTYYDRHL